MLKPNWMSHESYSGQGADWLATHASVLGAVLDLVMQVKPKTILVGDTPIRGCDLPNLMEVAGYNALKEHYARAAAPMKI